MRPYSSRCALQPVLALPLFWPLIEVPRGSSSRARSASRNVLCGRQRNLVPR